MLQRAIDENISHIPIYIQTYMHIQVIGNEKARTKAFRNLHMPCHARGAMIYRTLIKGCICRHVLYRLGSEQNFCCLLIDVVFRYLHWPHIEVWISLYRLGSEQNFCCLLICMMLLSATYTGHIEVYRLYKSIGQCMAQGWAHPRLTVSVYNLLSTSNYDRIIATTVAGLGLERF